jgi:hypothetical protein
MNTRTRIAITLASALALAVTAYGRTLTSVSLGMAHEIWGWASLAAYALAVIAVALVNRWWALLPAAVPMAVSAYIYNLTDFSTPWENESLHPTAAAWLILVPIAVALQAAFFSLGFLLRGIWHWGRRWHRTNNNGQGFGAGRLGS